MKTKEYTIKEGTEFICPSCGETNLEMKKYGLDDESEYMFWFDYKCNNCNSKIKYLTNFTGKG